MIGVVQFMKSLVFAIALGAAGTLVTTIYLVSSFIMGLRRFG